ncbi:MAG: glycerol-3-phosphate 1-O-acyltransferase PlsY [Verrucomicrobiota bacterium]
MLIPLIIAAVAGYLLGALPFGWLIARKFGINIFEHGSKNPGATNVKRVLGEKFGKAGKRAGNIAFILDVLKGALAAGWPLLVPGDHVWQMQLTSLVFALVGHSFSCFTRFKGGKGVATSAGGLLVLLPIPAAISVVVWVLVFEISRYVSLASIVAAVALPAAAWLVPGNPLAFAILATVMGVFVIIRHRTNIGRLLNGTENKFVKKSADPAAPVSRS